MKARCFVALFVLLGLTAFAPAPFPKPERRGQTPEITLATFQGTWRATAMHITRGKGEIAPHYYGWTHARVEKDRWTFISRQGDGNSLYLSIDHTKKPALMNFYNRPDKKAVYGVALIRRHNGKVQVMYRWGGEPGRPTTFETAPAGLWIVTLER